MQPDGGTTYDCTIKDGSGVVNPTISLKWDGSGSPALYNYAQIPDFGRYYWVSEWRYLDRQWIVTLRSDPMATAKTEIGAAYKYILRAGSRENLNVSDNKYPAKMPVYTQSGRAVFSEDPATDFSGGCYVLSIVGQGNSFSVGGSNYVFIIPPQLQPLLNEIFNANSEEWSVSSLGNTFGEALAAYGDKLNKTIQNPMQFINSIYWIPYVPVTTGFDTIKLGRRATTTFGAHFDDPIYKVTFRAQVPVTSGEPKWHYLEPFSSYSLYMPPFGTFPLDARMIASKGGVDGSIYIDLTNGQSLLEVEDPITKATLFQASGSMGIRISISGQNIDYAGQLQSAVGGVGGVVGAALTGNISGAIIGGISAVGNVIRGGMPTAVNGGISAGLSSLKGFKGIVRTFVDPVETDPADQGTPVMERLQISTLQGYVLCADGEISAALTDGELDQIAGFLTGGFFYE